MRGIDAQIMVTKSAELTKEYAKLLKQDQLQAEQAHAAARRQVRQDMKRTQPAGQAKGSRISRDGRGQDGARYEPEDRERDKGEESPGAPSELLLLPVERGEKTREKPRVIDIVV